MTWALPPADASASASWRLEAQRLEWQGDRLEAQGQVRLSLPGGVWRTEVLWSERSSRRLVAPTALAIEQGELSATAASGALDGRSGEAVLLEASGRWRAWRLGARELSTRGGALALSQAWLAHCPEPQPDLRLRVEQARLEPGPQGSVRIAAEGLRLEAGGLPLLAWPGLALELPADQEEWGLGLEPKLGADPYRGSFLELRPRWPLGAWGELSAPLWLSSLRGGGLQLAHGWNLDEAWRWQGEVGLESAWAPGRGGLRAQGLLTGPALGQGEWSLRLGHRAEQAGVPVSLAPELAWQGLGWRVGPATGQWEVAAGQVGEADAGLWSPRARALAQGQWPLARWGRWRLGLEGRARAAAYATGPSPGLAELAGGLRAQWGGGEGLGLWGLAEARQRWGQSPFLHDRAYEGERLGFGLAWPIAPTWSLRAEGELGRLGAGAFGPQDATLSLGHRWRCFGLEASWKPLQGGLQLALQGLNF